MTYIHAPVRVVLPDTNEVRVEIDNSERIVPIPSGAQGLPGEPGFSPIVTVEPITGGNRVTITDADGDTSFDVLNGSQGEQGEPGEGVPTGGVTGQVLKKRSNSDYDTYWANESGGGVTSVNGKTGAVVLDADDVGALPDTTVIPTKTSELTNDSGFITDAGVTSFNGQTGAVTYAAPVQSVNGATGAVVLDADEAGAMSKWDLLWTNASPSSAFAAQTVALDLSGYDAILVVIKKQTAENTFATAFATEKNKTFRAIFPSHMIYCREFSFSDTGVTFQDGKAYTSYGNNNPSTYNNDTFPVQIYGIKGVNS